MTAGNLLNHILHLLLPLGGANWGVNRMPDFYLVCSHKHSFTNNNYLLYTLNTPRSIIYVQSVYCNSTLSFTQPLLDFICDIVASNYFRPQAVDDQLPGEHAWKSKRKL